MKSLPQVTEFNAWMTIVMNSLNCWEFMFFDPIHELPSSQFLLAISWILKLKKLYFVLLTIHLYFQFSIFLVCLKLSRSLWQFASYHNLECLVILTFFECLYQILSVQLTKDWMISPSSSLFWILLVLSPLMDLINSMMKLSFFAVFNQSMLFGLNIFFKN